MTESYKIHLKDVFYWNERDNKAVFGDAETHLVEGEPKLIHDPDVITSLPPGVITVLFEYTPLIEVDDGAC